MVSPAPAHSRTSRHSRSGLASLARPSAALPHHPPSAASTADGLGMAGRYRIDPRSTAWWWSPEMYELLGLAPESTRPCIEALLQCQHREDRGDRPASPCGLTHAPEFRPESLPHQAHRAAPVTAAVAGAVCIVKSPAVWILIRRLCHAPALPCAYADCRRSASIA